VDHDIVSTYLVSGIDKEMDRMTAIYISRYPEDDNTPIYRGMRLAYSGRIDEGRALLDSALTCWRESESYGKYPKRKQGIESASFQFAALFDDVQGDHESAATAWGEAVAITSEMRPFHDQWYPRYRWAASLQLIGSADKALEIIDPMLRVNPRLINVLVLKVQCHLDLQQADKARKTLHHLQKALKKADKEMPARAKAEELALKVSALAVSN
jgi:tetratricopeptide (TPR) repeat protein